MFIHLHWHSHYSLLNWLGDPDRIIQTAKKIWMDTIAITDYWTMYWAIEFFELAKRNEIKPIIWMEIYQVSDIKKQETKDSRNNLVLLAKDLDWYHNLIEISSIANLEWFFEVPRTDMKILKKYSKWLIAFMWWEDSQIGKMILAKEDDKRIIEIIKEFKEIFWEENFILELVIQDYLKKINTRKVNDKIIELAEKTNTKLIINSNFHYPEKTDKDAYEALICIKNWTLFTDPTRKKTVWSYHILSQEEIIEMLEKNKFEKDFIDKLMQNNIDIANKITLEIPLHNLYFPDYKSPADIEKLYEKHKNTLLENNS